jgi:hypothetical protein
MEKSSRPCVKNTSGKILPKTAPKGKFCAFHGKGPLEIFGGI